MKYPEQIILRQLSATPALARHLGFRLYPLIAPTSAPLPVAAYRRNTETNARLRDAGVEVLELDASELCRGRGGSRWMTQPIRRDPGDRC